MGKATHGHLDALKLEYCSTPTILTPSLVCTQQEASKGSPTPKNPPTLRHRHQAPASGAALGCGGAAQPGESERVESASGGGGGGGGGFSGVIELGVLEWRWGGVS